MTTLESNSFGSIVQLEEYVRKYIPQKPSNPILIIRSEIPDSLHIQLREDYLAYPLLFATDCAVRNWKLIEIVDEGSERPWVVIIQSDRFNYSVYADQQVFDDITESIDEVEENKRTLWGRIKNWTIFKFIRLDGK